MLGSYSLFGHRLANEQGHIRTFAMAVISIATSALAGLSNDLGSCLRTLNFYQ